MKFFQKEKCLHYQKYQTKIPKLLVYTCANENYFPFAILYPLFVLQTNKDVAVEIVIENYKKFMADYGYLVDWYNKKYPDAVYFHPFEEKYKCRFGTTRFIIQPLWRGKYIYIGDVDIMITQEIAQQHINNIKKYNLDFSNIKRKGKNKLSGLHFIEYDKMYPIKIHRGLNLMKMWDEEVLYVMMKNKMYKIPDENICTFRPILGMHFSYYSRPPLPTLTTLDKIVDVYPSWFDNNDEYQCDIVQQYLKIRYSTQIREFMLHINPVHLELRKIIQYMDMSCWFFINQDNLRL